MERTWITIAASLLMRTGAVLVFVFTLEKNYFRNLEDEKYQFFWSDVEELVESVPRGEEELKIASQTALEESG